MIDTKQNTYVRNGNKTHVKASPVWSDIIKTGHTGYSGNRLYSYILYNLINFTYVIFYISISQMSYEWLNADILLYRNDGIQNKYELYAQITNRQIDAIRVFVEPIP